MKFEINLNKKINFKEKNYALEKCLNSETYIIYKL